MIRLLFVAVVLTAPATARTPDAPPTAAPAGASVVPHTFVSPDQLDLPRVLPPWPAPGTLASQADMLTILARTIAPDEGR